MTATPPTDAELQESYAIAYGEVQDALHGLSDALARMQEISAALWPDAQYGDPPLENATLTEDPDETATEKAEAR